MSTVVNPKTARNRERRKIKKLRKQLAAGKLTDVQKRDLYAIDQSSFRRQKFGPRAPKGPNQPGKSNQKHIQRLRNGMKSDDRDFRRMGNRNIGSSTTNYMSNLENEIAFDVTSPSSVFYSMPAGIVSLCLQRGWMAGAENPSIPYLAFGYLCYIVQSFALNITLPTIRIPRCIALFCHSLMTKSVPAMGGKVNYKFNFTQDTTFPSQLQLGPTADANWSLWVPDSTKTGVWANFMTPTVWTIELGQSAYQSLVQFLENSSYAADGNALQLVAAGAPNKMDKDVSAFAVTYADPGGAYNFTGGFGKQVYLEVPIHSPLFAVNYYNPLNALDINRYGSFTSSFAGSGFLLSALATVLKERWTGMKAPPTFKCIDLNEFIEVYALVIQKALYIALNDPQTQAVLLAMAPADVQAYLYAQYQCPITLQEFSILLRDVMMNLLKDTQFAVQDIFPRSSAVTDAPLFTACVAGTNTCSLGGATSMLIPRILAENMRSCTFAIMEVGKNNRSPLVAFPILGVYSGVVLDTADYTVAITLNAVTYSFTIFAYNVSEVPISLIDGTTSGDAAIVGINDPAANNMLTGMFNDWFTGDSQVSSFVSTPTTLATDSGVSILTNMNITLYWTQQIDDNDRRREKRRNYWRAMDAWTTRTEKEKKVSKEPVPDWPANDHEQRFGRKNRKFSHLDTSPYATAVVQNISCRYPLLAAIWEGGQQFFIKPQINAVTEGTVQASNQISRIAAQQREFNNLIVTQGSTTTVLTLAYYHDQLASLMVGARNAPSKGTEFEVQLAELSKNGHGSIFSDIASAFSSVAGPLVQVGLPLAMGALKKGRGKNMIMG